MITRFTRPTGKNEAITCASSLLVVVGLMVFTQPGGQLERLRVILAYNEDRQREGGRLALNQGYIMYVACFGLVKYIPV